jgi:predicted protein tyrosine phosphatase
MNILFVCTANKERSRTAEIYFQYNYRNHRFRSAGINRWLCERHGGLFIKQYMLVIADVIICMEQCHADYINEHFDNSYNNKIHILGLGDTDVFMSGQLTTELIKKVRHVQPEIFN